ncbi:MAG: M4 family metallopeptidase, partial [candidate division Zixibacteria bacterium]|nr:M4 family metallopeptidase [candidate division Zixibacteria bacterium]
MREAGALDESFSDMLGVSVARANGDYDWYVAENSFVGPFALRNMSDPTTSNQPDTYKGTNWYGQDTCLVPNNSNDSCGIYKNMGVPNKMFYLLANGGTHNGVTVLGMGIDTAMAIMFKANRENWDSAAGFSFVDAAVGSIKAAFNTNYFSSWPQQTSRAWSAVKVCTIMPGDPDTSEIINLIDVQWATNYYFDQDRPATGCYGNSPGNCWTSVPLCRLDANGDGAITMADVIWLVNYVFDKDRA